MLKTSSTNHQIEKETNPIMNKKDVSAVAEVLSRHAKTGAEGTLDYARVAVVNAMVIDMAITLGDGSPRFNVDVFLRDIYQNDLAAASVKAAYDYVMNVQKGNQP